MQLSALGGLLPGPDGMWLPVGTGTAVGFLVFLMALRFSARRVSFLDVLLLRRCRRRLVAPVEEDVPNAVVTPEALQYLKTPDEDHAFLKTAPERRTSGRRWGKPVEVRLLVPFSFLQLRGVVINRSTGGLAILVDDAYPEGTLLKVRSVHAPEDVGWLEVEVRHSRAAGKNWVIGCKYTEPPPWNAVVWLG